MEIHLRKSRRD